MGAFISGMQMTKNAATATALVGIWRVILTASIILALYFGQDVLIPVALAALLSFVLTPLVKGIERWIGRVAAVLIVVTMLCSVVGSTAWVLTRQLVDVGKKIPDYRENIENKIRGLQIPGGGAFFRLSQMIGDLKKELTGTTPIPPQAEGEVAKPGTKAAKVKPSAPMPVEVVGTSGFGVAEFVQKSIIFLAGPLGKSALVLLLLIFILMQRDDIRGRVVRLVGQGNISATTLAIDDAWDRLSHYLRWQLLVNISYGGCVAVGLYFIGIPNAMLWGGLAGILRFIPYLGPWLGAAAPTILSLAISSSWVTPILTFGLFLVLELINGNVIEPWLYGSVTGVTPVALVVGAIFWTWIWGPVGLLLATPLMVCLVVLGRHVPNLTFLSVLLSEERALTPQEECYHRLLAADPDEASTLIDSYLNTNSLAALFDDVLIPVITRAEMDYQRELLNEGQRDSILQSIREIVEDLRDRPVAEPSESAGEAANKLVPVIRTARTIFCFGARSERDELAAMMLAQLLSSRGFSTIVISPQILDNELTAALAEKNPVAICLSFVSPATIIHARRLILKMRGRFPKMKIMVGLWGSLRKGVDVEEGLRVSGADEIAVSLTDALELFSPTQGNEGHDGAHEQ